MLARIYSYAVRLAVPVPVPVDHHIKYYSHVRVPRVCCIPRAHTMLSQAKHEQSVIINILLTSTAILQQMYIRLRFEHVSAFEFWGNSIYYLPLGSKHLFCILFHFWFFCLFFLLAPVRFYLGRRTLPAVARALSPSLSLSLAGSRFRCLLALSGAGKCCQFVSTAQNSIPIGNPIRHHHSQKQTLNSVELFDAVVVNNQI